MTTLSDGVTTITPILVTGWDSVRDGENVLHNVVGRAGHDVTYRPAGLRRGTLECLCDSLEVALQVEALAAQPKPLTLADVDHPAVNMTFVLDGQLRVTLDEDTRKQATCAIDFQQIDTP